MKPDAREIERSFEMLKLIIRGAAISHAGEAQLAEIIRHVADWVEGGCTDDLAPIQKELAAWSSASIQILTDAHD